MDRNFAAVIFDFGGVITSSPFEAFQRLEAERGLPRDFIRRINATNPDDNAWARLERSEIDMGAFDGLFAEEAAGQAESPVYRNATPYGWFAIAAMRGLG